MSTREDESLGAVCATLGKSLSTLLRRQGNASLVAHINAQLLILIESACRHKPAGYRRGQVVEAVAVVRRAGPSFSMPRGCVLGVVAPSTSAWMRLQEAVLSATLPTSTRKNSRADKEKFHKRISYF
eukprot:6173591-Pleurochrysis_carterae.AAC.8